MKRIILSVTILVLLGVNSYSRVASKVILPFIQPDGKEVPVRTNGDEFFHFLTTADGCIVTKGDDGWLHFCYIDNEGKLKDSGIRYSSDAPQDIVSGSKIIPDGIANSNRYAKMSVLQSSGVFDAKGFKPSLCSTSGQTKNNIVILAQYKDIKFRYTKDDFVKMLTQKGYSKFGATGCVAEYFDAQFNGKVKFQFDVSDIVTLSESRKYYGKNENGQDARPEAMIAEACRLADSKISFNKYDNDGDNVVDNVFVFFAGADEAETRDEDAIWSHAYYIYSGATQIDLRLDGVRIDRYACTSELTYRQKSARTYLPELAGIGTFCHEYSHTFGLPDFYDTDYEESGGLANGMWQTTSLMDNGNSNNQSNTPPYYNAVEREILGLSVPEEIMEEGQYTLEPVHLNGKCFRISTTNPDEYYLLECRYPEGWDKFCGGQGLLIYHIDKSDQTAGYSATYRKTLTADARWQYNEVNCRPDRECAKIIPAAKTNTRSVFFPQKNITGLSETELKYWDGGHSNISLHEITGDGKNIKFTVKKNGEQAVYPLNIRETTFQHSAIIEFNTSATVSEATVSWAYQGGQSASKTVTEYSPNKYSIRIDGLLPNTTYIASISLGNSKAISKQITIKTKPYLNIPLIYLANPGDRNNDGTFRTGTRLPLEVLATGRYSEVKWTFDGHPVKTGTDNFFHLEKSGVLKASIFYPDGKIENITKEITIR